MLLFAKAVFIINMVHWVINWYLIWRVFGKAKFYKPQILAPVWFLINLAGLLAVSQ